MTMKPPRKFYEPLAIGAPAPYRDLPVTLERMIHFFPPHNEKLRGRLPEMIGRVDVLLGNLEDAIPIDAKQAARKGFIEAATANDFGDTGLWVRINCLNSPWFLDDVTEIVAAAGNKLDVVMLPKVEGPWDIHYLDQLLAQLEARHRIEKPILIHAILETALGVANVEAIAGASPRLHGMSLGPADLALALHRGEDGRCLPELRYQGVLRPVRGFLRRCGLRGAVPQRLSAGLRRRLVAASQTDRDRQAGVQPGCG
jgi:malyl-CoA/(S)-citramalyl-CoA lyase